MNIIQPKYEIVEQKYNDLTTDMFKHIERCGRICYKSDDKITEDSYIKFVERLEKSNHGAMLEHGTVYLTIPVGSPSDDVEYLLKKDIVKFFKENKYSVVKNKTINETINVELLKGYNMPTEVTVNVYYITTNWRVIYENKDYNIIRDIEEFHVETDTLENMIIKYMTTPSENHEKRYTVIFTCDIGVTREYNRHRVDSIAEESTRYCNYSKEKFGDGLNICQPCWLDIKETDYKYFIDYIDAINRDDAIDNFIDIDYWMFANLACEYSYLNLIRLGWKPQQARTVLPLDTKSCLVHTAFAKDWVHFFDLRAIGTTGQPHPSAQELAMPLMQEFIKRKYIV